MYAIHDNASMTSAAKLKEDAYISTHIEELKDKMRTLQNDRKTNIDVLEANKQANKDDMKRLREENKELRQKLAHLQRTVAQDIEKDEVKTLERQIDNLRRELDETKLRTSRLRKILDAERDKVRSLELDSHKPHLEDNDRTRRIRSLENKLDKAMIKFNEAQSIKKTYEVIVKRLQEERIGYDNQLSIMERTLNAKKRDYEELIVLSGDSIHAKEAALNELDRVRHGYEEERRRRERELKDRYNVIQLRKNMLAKIKEREKLRRQLEEEYGRTTQAANALVAKQIITEKLEQKNKIEIFESAFRKIKEATGVSDVNEVINKIISQESTTENLIALTHENQRKLELLMDEKKEMKLKVEELKYSGMSGGIRRKLVDDSEDQLSNSMGRLERNRTKYDRLNKMLISMKAGIGHLQDKLYSNLYSDDIIQGASADSNVNPEGKANHLIKILKKSSPSELTDETILDVLQDQESLLLMLSKLVKQGQDKKQQYQYLVHRTADISQVDNLSIGTNGSTNFSDKLSGIPSLSISAGESTMPTTAKEKVTFADKSQPLNATGTNYFDSSITEEVNTLIGLTNDVEDDEVTRDQLKKQASQILLLADKKKKKLNHRNSAKDETSNDQN